MYGMSPLVAARENPRFCMLWWHSCALLWPLAWQSDSGTKLAKITKSSRKKLSAHQFSFEGSPKATLENCGEETSSYFDDKIKIWVIHVTWKAWNCKTTGIWKTLQVLTLFSGFILLIAGIFKLNSRWIKLWDITKVIATVELYRWSPSDWLLWS